MPINASLSYRADIDGLRAIAVVAVALFHAGVSCSGGYVGVDIFFVISGFLITRLIVKEIHQDRFSLINFWNRRIRRIFPILSVVLVTTLCLGYWILWPQDLVDLAKSVTSMSLVVSNIHFWLDTGYFAESAEFKPLLHTWSLSIEEQFYILYPLLLVLITSRLKKKHSIILLTILCLGSFALNSVSTFIYPRSTFYLLPTRAWELLIGGLLVFQPTTMLRHRWVSEILSLVGIIAVAVAIFEYDQSIPYPGVAALIPVGGAMLIIYGNSRHPTLIRRLLSLKPAVFVGLISYSFYLWHLPLLIFARILYWEEPYVDLWALGVGWLLSICTWQLVEQPFRRKNGRHALVFGSALLISITLVVLSSVVVLLEGVPSRANSFQLLQQNNQFEITDQGLLSGNAVRMGLELTDSSRRTDFMVIGDSHTLAVLPTLHDLAKEYHLQGIGQVRTGRSPFGDHADYRTINQAITKTLQSEKPRVVLLIARWTSFFGKDSVATQFGQNLEVLRDIVTTSKEVNAKIYIMAQVPWHNIPRPVVRWRQINAKQKPAHHQPPQILVGDYQDGSKSSQLAFQFLIEEGAQILDPTPYCFNNEGKIKWPESDDLLYWDDNHLTQFGGRALLAPMYKKLFEEIAAHDE